MDFFEQNNTVQITERVSSLIPPYSISVNIIHSTGCVLQVASNSRESNNIVECDYKIFCPKIPNTVPLKRGQNIKTLFGRTITGKITQFETVDIGRDSDGKEYGTVLWVKETI